MTSTTLLSSKSFTMYTLDGIFLVVHEDVAIDPNEWEEACRILEQSQKREGKPLRMLVVPSDQSMPTAAQRSRLANLVQSQSRIAVITEQLAIRAIVKAIGFFFSEQQIRAYAPKQAKESYQWIGLNPQQQLTVDGIIKRTHKF